MAKTGDRSRIPTRKREDLKRFRNGSTSLAKYQVREPSLGNGLTQERKILIQMKKE